MNYAKIKDEIYVLQKNRTLLPHDKKAKIKEMCALLKSANDYKRVDTIIEDFTKKVEMQAGKAK